MNKKTISDIRLFKSESQNEYGVYSTEYFGDKSLTAIVNRIVMKLRENEFSLGEFDHLYINFTTCDMAEEMNLSDKVDRYHPWFRYCNIHVEEDLYNKLGSPESWNDIIRWIGTILVAYFISEDFDNAIITGRMLYVKTLMREQKSGKGSSMLSDIIIKSGSSS